MTGAVQGDLAGMQLGCPTMASSASAKFVDHLLLFGLFSMARQLRDW